MGWLSRHKKLAIAGGVVVVIAIAAAVGLGGLAHRSNNTQGLVRSALQHTAGSSDATVFKGQASSEAGTAYSSNQSSSAASSGATDLSALSQMSGQKIVSNGSIEIQVKSGGFEKAYDDALFIATRYGGYVLSSTSSVGSDGGGLKSGTVSIRVPSTSFTNALADASKLGTLKNRSVQTQDVTEEYVDLQARIANSRAQVQALQALLAKAKTIDEILTVQQTLSSAQQDLEQLVGRQRYLDENTNYSTIAMTIYEDGSQAVVSSDGWGIKQALSDAAHNVIDVVNGIIRGLGVLIPVIVVVAIVCWVAYAIWRSRVRRRQKNQEIQGQ